MPPVPCMQGFTIIEILCQHIYQIQTNNPFLQKAHVDNYVEAAENAKADKVDERCPTNPARSEFLRRVLLYAIMTDRALFPSHPVRHRSTILSPGPSDTITRR